MKTMNFEVYNYMHIVYISVFNVGIMIMIMCKLFPKYEEKEFIICEVVFGLERKNNELYL